ncbi:hypothetical protein RB7045 [Rhodopirellula baltica SH 1]|uniref:Uncharacterized protein n=1 Tax=Rhodopirellula baltica (strain DSM 10527 / NCIMB 13988 / SH1) TaxID=243090 RepID=Q7UPB6_RHOBA|nr:hypothetical protein RB7045 [Rhodopirellula baltica SH 1]
MGHCDSDIAGRHRCIHCRITPPVSFLLECGKPGRCGGVTPLRRVCGVPQPASTAMNCESRGAETTFTSKFMNPMETVDRSGFANLVQFRPEPQSRLVKHRPVPSFRDSESCVTSFRNTDGFLMPKSSTFPEHSLFSMTRELHLPLLAAISTN